MIVYDRDAGSLSVSEYPTGTVGQISMQRLCAALEECGEVRPHERITHLVFIGDMVRYRIVLRT